MAVFLTVVLAVWAAMHLYVFWRLGSVPWVAAHCSTRALVCIAVALWLSYPLARMFESRGWDRVGLPLEFFAANWIGVLFLLVAAMLLTDLLTLGGRLFADRAPAIRGGAALVAFAASALALIQGFRAPTVTEHEVALPGLPAAREGTRIAVLSDLHLGTLLGRRWLEDRIAQVRQLNPDLILLVGDVVDGNNRRITPLVPTLGGFRAPLGVFAVTGNHEFYAGVEASVACLESAGIKLLRDSAVEAAPGLVIAGVDDLTARQQFEIPGDGLLKALQGRPAGGTVLMSHTPWQPERAAELGAGLMVSGHTHNGQLWPFNHLVRLRYTYVSGRHDFGKMTLLVGRGSGTWGPRMRLWQPGELLLVRLKAA